MKDHKKGWVRREDLFILPIEKQGFASMVLRRPHDRDLAEPIICRLNTNEEIAVPADDLLIGSQSDADVILESGGQAHIFRRGRQYYLEGLGEDHQIRIEETPIQGEVLLTDGMIFKIGDETFRFVFKQQTNLG